MKTENSTIICIDLQQKLVKMIEKKSIVQNAVKIMKTASILNIDAIITEQYPQGLGSTIDEIKSIKDFKIIEKTNFSVLSDIENEKLNKNIILFGIETHICVYQSALDLINKGYNVYVIHNCCASRSKTDHKTALKLLQQSGAKITSLEIVLFEFLKSSKHPNFKEIQALIK